jgi:hypothetical protein
MANNTIVNQPYVKTETSGMLIHFITLKEKYYKDEAAIYFHQIENHAKIIIITPHSPPFR